MKILIRKGKSSGYWLLRVDNWHSWFLTFEDACNEAEKRWKRYRKECSAKSMVDYIPVHALSIEDQMFILKAFMKDQQERGKSPDLGGLDTPKGVRFCVL